VHVRDCRALSGEEGSTGGKVSCPARQGRRHTDCSQALKHRAAYVVPTGRRNKLQQNCSAAGRQQAPPLGLKPSVGMTKQSRNDRTIKGARAARLKSCPVTKNGRASTLG